MLKYIFKILGKLFFIFFFVLLYLLMALIMFALLIYDYKNEDLTTKFLNPVSFYYEFKKFINND